MRFALSSAILLSLLAAPLFVGSARAETLHYHADMVGSSEVPPTTSAGTGTMDASFDTDSKKLSYTLTWSGLTGPATMAHFHGPAAVGVSAGVQVPLGMDITSPLSGSATLSAEQVQQLQGGLWYVNVHSAKFPKGEIRGQVLLIK